MSIARRSINSVTWNSLANLVSIPVGFVQSILLARLLPVEYFGIYGGAVALVTLISQIFDLGLNNAFIHRSEQTQDEEKAIAVLFTVRFILRSLQLIILIVISIFFFHGIRLLVFLVLSMMGFLTGVIATPQVLLVRQIEFKRLSILNIVASVLTALVSVLIAWLSRSIWALLISSVITFISTFVVFYVWRPIWQPRFLWDKPILKYYASFGSRVQVSNVLNVTLDHLDDLWTNIYLGDKALGFYSRAYKFATYPRTFMALPVQTVATSTLAELKNDRGRLSGVFIKVNAFLIRGGFLFAGWLGLISPQFIRLFLGENWLPMLDAFRLLVIFALLDPLKDTLANTLIALGIPGKVIIARSVQLGTLITGLFILGRPLGIFGVALSANIMVAVGIGLLFSFTKPYLDFSIKQLFRAPLAALIVSLPSSWFILNRWLHNFSDWWQLIIGSLVFVVFYLLILVWLEGRALFQMVQEVLEISSPDQPVLRIIHSLRSKYLNEVDPRKIDDEEKTDI